MNRYSSNALAAVVFLASPFTTMAADLPESIEACTTAAVPKAAHSNPDVAFAERVSYADLDLTVPSGVAALDARLNRAATLSCRRLASSPGADVDTACAERAVRQAYHDLRRQGAFAPRRLATTRP